VSAATFDPQTQVLIDQGTITLEQAHAAAAATPAADEIVGIVRCLNAGCGRYDEPREVRLRKQTVFHRAPGLPLIESSSTHLVAVDDADLYCPVDGGCGGPCAVQEHAPPTYQKMLVV
jgi:hypothetical protein